MSSPRPRVSGIANTERPPPPEETSSVVATGGAASAPAGGEGTGGFAGGAWIGRLVEDRYRVESLLGEGGMGAVFLAEHVKLAKKVALKVILPQFAGDGEVAERFAREAMASARLDHPHVASALDYGALPEGGAYLVMPYVRGRSLRDAMEAAPGGWRFACEIGAQIADALAAAHAQKIVHRDLKPENVILEPRDDGSETVKVLDFGVARVVGDDPHGAPGGTAKALTRVGTIIGTPGYMAPEQALGETVDARADLYALGVVLWEIVARRALFEDDDLTAIVTRQLTTEPPRLSAVAADVPAELDELVARLLARTREQRPERAGEVRDVLKRLALGATLEQKMLSGELALPSARGDTPAPLARDPSTPIAVGSAATIARAGDASRPSVVIPPSVASAARSLEGNVDIGPLRNVPRSLVLAGCATPIALGAMAAVLLAVFGGGGSDATSVPDTGAAVAPEGTVPTATSPSLPSLPSIPSPADLFGGRGAAPSAEIPAAIAEDVATLMTAESHDDRDAAARRLRDGALDSAPPFVAAAVDLELARDCRARRDAVRRLGEIADPRALPALDRLDRARRGCGFLGSQDCHRCLRRDLREALRALRPSAPPR